LFIRHLWVAAFNGLSAGTVGINDPDSCWSARETSHWQKARDMKTFLKAIAGVTLVLGTAIPSNCGAQTSALGEIHGTTRDSGAAPLARVQVTLHGVDRNSDRTVFSGSDGVFMAQNLTPGPYQVIANKEGFATSASTVQVVAGESLRNDIALASANHSVAAGTLSTPAANGDAPLTEREKQLLDRLDQLERRLAAMEAKEAKANQSDATAPPLLASLKPAVVVPAEKPKELPILPAPVAAKPAPAAAPPALLLAEALQAPEATTGVDNFTPFAYGDFTWLNGTARTKEPIFDTKFFTPEVRFDTHYMQDFNEPIDHTMGGATESFRSGEIQVEQISVGGDFHWHNVRGRILTMDGLFATTTPRNDASAGVGQWDVRGAYKYVSEAYGGYHFNVNHGLNVDAGIFVSYIGLFSYYNFDNWIYQPSYVSSNTPWFFNGVRIQWFPTNKLKIEPWIINGWQSYNKYNGHMGLGGQILYRPREWVSMVFNQYGYGQDNLGLPKVERIHTDDSLEMRYYNNPESTGITRMAFSLTGDLGCQYGPGFRCTGGATKDSFAGWMAYNRLWFGEKYALSFGGGRMNNPGRYLTLLPPINGADAVSGSPYFPETPGLPAHMWDSSIGFQWMPKQWVTWWLETGYRHSDVPYWTGRHGITPPLGNTGDPADYVCSSGVSSNATDLATAEASCGGGPGSVWFPDLRRGQAVLSAGIMVKF
jgi:hypothetical protein